LRKENDKCIKVDKRIQLFGKASGWR